MRSFARVTYVVDDYDKAIAFFTEQLDFVLIEDTYIPAQDKRWVVVAPNRSNGLALVLGRATNPAQRQAIGNQTGGRVFLFLNTDDFWSDFNTLKSRGIEFVRDPKKEPYGTVAVFKDLYGNLWDLIQPTNSPT